MSKDNNKSMAEIILKGKRCERCGHKYTPKNPKENLQVCPKTKSTYGNKPRKKQSASSADRLHNSFKPIKHIEGMKMKILQKEDELPKF